MKYLLKISILFVMAITAFAIYAEDLPSAYSRSTISPDLSFYMDFSYLYRDMKDEKFDGIDVPWLINGKNIYDYSDDLKNTRQGFALNYGKVVLQAEADQYFRVYTDISGNADGIKIDEAYIKTISLPAYFSFKAGQFLSGFGDFNSRQPYNWYFLERPVIYTAFFGDNQLLERGAQLTWQVPLDFYLLVGAEYLNGENKMSYGTAAIKSGNKVVVKSSEKPNLFTAFMKGAVAVANLDINFGFSFANGKMRKNNVYTAGADTGYAIYADSMILDANLSFKYNFSSYHYVLLEGECLQRNVKGDFYWSNNNASPEHLTMEQRGFFAHLILKPFMHWRIGGRYEMIFENSVSIKQVSGTEDDRYKKINNKFNKKVSKYSAMIDYNVTEFSRIRMEYSHDAMRYDEKAKNINVQEISFQFTMAYGTSGTKL
jgi:hypothetical protein